jgi:hypothetical protein
MSTFLTTGALKEDVLNVISSLTPISLTKLSPAIIHVTGTDTQLITLPDASSLAVGVHYFIVNDSSKTVTVQDFLAATIITVESGQFTELFLVNATLPAGTWAKATLSSLYPDKNIKLIGGGIWSWNLSTTTVQFTDDAYVVVVPGLPTVNTLLAGSFTLDYDEVAYVTLNRTVGGPPLTIVTTTSDLVPTDTNDILIIAYRDGSDVVIGSSFRLIEGQSSELDQGLSVETRTLLGTFITPATSSPDWLVRSAPLRTIPDIDTGIIDTIVSIDTEFDKYFGQLRLIPHGTLTDNIQITEADQSALTGETLSQELGSRILDFAGSTINFTTGVITPYGLNFTPATIPVGEYLWYCVLIEYTGTNALGQSTARVQIRAASASDLDPALAPYPQFPALFRSRPLGMIQVFNNAGTIELYAIRQLGVGGGGGGSGGGGSGVIVRAIDFTTTTLPTGAGPLVVDGVTISNEDMILYGNAALNRVYKVTGIGSSLLFEEVGVFSNGNVIPQDGDKVSAADGLTNDVTWEWDADTSTWSFITLSTENKQWLGLTEPDKSGGIWETQVDPLGQTNNVLVEGEILEKAMKRLDIRPDVLKRVRAIDLTATTLPAVAPVVIDGITLIDDDKVLFGSSTLLGIYQVSDLSGTVTWTQLNEFGGSLTPSAHDAVLVREGTEENCTIWLYDSALTPPWHRVSGPASTVWTGSTPNTPPTWDGTLSDADTTVKLALDTIDKYFRGLQLRQHVSDPNRVTILASNTTKTDLTTLNFTIADRLMSFAGAEIDFENGVIYESDGITVITTFVPYTIPQDEYFWYAIGLDSSPLESDATINPTFTIGFSTGTGLSPAAAPKPELTSRYTLGVVVVKGDTGGVGITPITQGSLVYLGQFTGITDLENTVAQHTIDIATLQAFVASMPLEQRFLVGAGGQSVFNLTTFSVDPSNALFDVDYILDGRWQTQSILGDFSDGAVRKNSSTQVETAEVVPEGKEFIVLKRTMSGGAPLVDLTAITVDLGFVTPHTVGTLARPAWSFILKDKVTADIWELEVRNGVFQVVKIN